MYTNEYGSTRINNYIHLFHNCEVTNGKNKNKRNSGDEMVYLWIS